MLAQTVNIFIAGQPATPSPGSDPLLAVNAARYFTDFAARMDEQEAAERTAAAPPASTGTPTPPAVGELWPGQGGYYIGRVPPLGGKPGYHLVVAAEEEDDLQWGPGGITVLDASSQHDGAANTATLIALPDDYPAAEYAASYTADGHRDFYLPSRFELLLCHIAAPQLFQKSSYYWSSSQHSPGSAWVQDFEYGYSNGHYKDNEYRSRAVRRFAL